MLVALIVIHSDSWEWIIDVRYEREEDNLGEMETAYIKVKCDCGKNFTAIDARADQVRLPHSYRGREVDPFLAKLRFVAETQPRPKNFW